MRPPLLLPWLAGLLLTAAAVLGAAPARADGFLVPTRPGRPVRGGWAVTYHKVDITVRGPQARVRVDEEFVNLGPTALEAEYVFPLPHGAMVSSITLFENGKALEGRLLRADEARRAYEEIVRRQKDPALLEYLGEDFFRVRVFPIPPGARRRVILTYEQLLPRDGKTTELVYPLGTEKFSARPLEVASVSIDLDAASPLGPIYSPSHDIVVARPSKNVARVTWSEKGVLPLSDFVLYWGTTRGPIGAELLSYWPKGDDRGYFLFLASPTVGDAEAAIRPKQITFVVDTSGSMAGEKIEQVKAALRQVIGALNEGDHFNVIAYHTAVIPLWKTVRPYTDANRKEAIAFVNGLRAQGGTNIQEALTSALEETPPEGLPSMLLFLTDGRPTVGTTDTDLLLKAVDAANPGSRVRLFAFGVGVDVNTVLLDRLALENHGAPTFVRPEEDVEPKVAALYEKIRYPILTDLAFEARGLRVTELLPAVMPDLFKGSQIVLAGRYGRAGRAEAVLSGRDGGVRREFHTFVSAAGRGRGFQSDFPARVWATRRIAALIDEIRLKKRADEELVDEIVRLSTRFGILTEYTAFLASETADHTLVAANTARAGRILDELGKREVGGAGVAQGKNQASRRDADRAAAPEFWTASEDDRDVSTERIEGVRQRGNRTFYRRLAGWVDVGVRNVEQPDETIVRWTPRFFEFLRKTTQEENARLAQAGTLVLEIQGRVVRIVDPS
ncbi:MAG: VIT domain-containing protein [Planctomycetota bacterium]